MARIHGCHVTSREAMLFMKYEHYGKCKGSFEDSQRKCKYLNIYEQKIFYKDLCCIRSKVHILIAKRNVPPKMLHNVLGARIALSR